MDLSPEEYGAYWRASARVSAGGLAIFFGHQFVSPFLEHPEPGATLLGAAVFVALVVVGTYVAVLGLARAVRTAVDVETRRG